MLLQQQQQKIDTNINNNNVNCVGLAMSDCHNFIVDVVFRISLLFNVRM